MATDAPPSPAKKPPKTMSTRLLTMKFMQRAAAAASATAGSGGGVSSPGTPSTGADFPSPVPKRQKMNNGDGSDQYHPYSSYSPKSGTFAAAAVSSPSPSPLFSGHGEMRAALAAEEARREAAVDRHMRMRLHEGVGGADDAAGVETKWTYEFKKNERATSNSAMVDGVSGDSKGNGGGEGSFRVEVLGYSGFEEGAKYVWTNGRDQGNDEGEDLGSMDVEDSWHLTEAVPGRRLYGQRKIEEKQSTTTQRIVGSGQAQQQQDEKDNDNDDEEGEESDADSSSSGSSTGESPDSGEDKVNYLATQLGRSQNEVSAVASRDSSAPSTPRSGGKGLAAATSGKRKEVNLSQLTSLSGKGPMARKPTKGGNVGACFSCGEKGHMKRDCPRMKRA